MTVEQLNLANKLQEDIYNAKRNISMLKENTIIALLSEQGMGKVEYRLNDEDVRELLIQHYTKRLEILKNKFDEL